MAPDQAKTSGSLRAIFDISQPTSRVDLQLLTRGTVDQRDRRRRAAEIEIDDGEPMARGVE